MPTIRVKNVKVDFEAYCPDPFCYERLFFEKDNKTESVRCFYCGQTIPFARLINARPLDDEEADDLYKRIETIPARSGAEWTRVDGLSSFYCKVVSHLYTDAGFQVKSTVQSNSQNRRLDCSQLHDCAFAIDETDLLTYGYGRDFDNSQLYLKETLAKIMEQNNSVEVLAPLRVSGDGSCLVHALSRALVGREIYWHPLRECLRQNLIDNELKYKEVLGGFMAEDDWTEMVNECDASYSPLDERLGLRNHHIFVFANVLCRPIILLDDLKIMEAGAEFSAVFLPVLRTVAQCRNEAGDLNKPLVVAWANAAHDHFVPLVKIDGRPLPKMARSFLPKAWCVNDDQMERYILFSENFCNVACGRIVIKSYARHMFYEIDAKFTHSYGVKAQIFCDYCESMNISFRQNTVEDHVRICLNLANEKMLYRCLICWRLIRMPLPHEDVFGPGSPVYKDLTKSYKNWKTADRLETQNAAFQYDKKENRFRMVEIYVCVLCKSGNQPLRLQTADGTILYKDGDHTRTPAPSANCKRKMKHYFRGNFYDNLPSTFTKNTKVSCIDPLWRLNENDDDENTNETIRINTNVDASNKINNVKQSLPSLSKLSNRSNQASSPTPRLTEELNLQVVFENGNTGFVQCKCNVTEEELRKAICTAFSIRPTQIAKIGYIIGQKNFDSFPNNISGCTGLIVHAQQDNVPKTTTNVERSETITNVTELRNIFDANVGTNRFWKIIHKESQFFKPSGVIYNMIRNEKGLKHGRHYTFSAFPNITFVYCGRMNIIQVCVRNVGHFEVNEKLEEEIRAKQSTVAEGHVDKALNDYNKTVQKCALPFSNIFCYDMSPGCVHKK